MLSMFKIQNGVFHKKKMLHASKCSICLTITLILIMLIISTIAINSWGSMLVNISYLIDLKEIGKYEKVIPTNLSGIE